VKDADYMIDLLDQRIYEQGMYVKPTSRKNSIHIIGEVAKKIEDIDEEGENFWIYANETDLFLESGSDFWHAAIKNDEVSDLEEMPERAATVSAASAVTLVPVEKADTTGRETAAAPAEQKEEMPETEETKQEGLHAEILKLKKLGMTEVQIAKKLGIGIGEVRLVNGLYRGESDS
jgi:hypothetical protein